MINRLGTWTTFDCPTEKQEEAFQWLIEKFEPIGGRVFVHSNPHDFGEYPSFEIDMPSLFEDIIDEDDETITDELREEKEVWCDKANGIEEEYSRAFADFL